MALVASSYLAPQAYLLSDCPTPQVPSHEGWEALQMELNPNKDGGLSNLEVSLRLNQSMPCFKTACNKIKKDWSLS